MGIAASIDRQHQVGKPLDDFHYLSLSFSFFLRALTRWLHTKTNSHSQRSTEKACVYTYIKNISGDSQQTIKWYFFSFVFLVCSLNVCFFVVTITTPYHDINDKRERNNIEGNTPYGKQHSTAIHTCWYKMTIILLQWLLLLLLQRS